MRRRNCSQRGEALEGNWVNWVQLRSPGAVPPGLLRGECRHRGLVSAAGLREAGWPQGAKKGLEGIVLGWAPSPLLLLAPGGEDPAAHGLAQVSKGLGAACPGTPLLCACTSMLLCGTAVSSQCLSS